MLVRGADEVELTFEVVLHGVLVGKASKGQVVLDVDRTGETLAMHVEVLHLFLIGHIYHQVVIVVVCHPVRLERHFHLHRLPLLDLALRRNVGNGLSTKMVLPALEGRHQRELNAEFADVLDGEGLGGLFVEHDSP